MIRLFDALLLSLTQPPVRGDKALLEDMNAARQRHRLAKRQAIEARTVSRLFD